MNFDFLFQPVEQLDSLITGLFDGAPLLVALGIAFLLGLRHASDPDHLVAVTSLMAAEDVVAGLRVHAERHADRLGAIVNRIERAVAHVVEGSQRWSAAWL